MSKDIDRKHILIVGKKREDRLRFLNDLINGINKLIYRFPPNLKTFNEYIEQVRKLFPFVLINWDEQNPKKWTRNQVWDFHLNWTENTHSILIILEEFDEMDTDSKFEILRAYLQTSYYQEKQNNGRLNFQLVVTQENDDGLVEKIASILGLNKNEKRTEEQVILGKLKIIDLDYM